MSAEVGSDTISATELTKLLIVVFSMKWLSPGPLVPEFLLGGATSDSMLGGVLGIGGSPVVQGLFLEVLVGAPMALATITLYLLPPVEPLSC